MVGINNLVTKNVDNVMNNTNYLQLLSNFFDDGTVTVLQSTTAQHNTREGGPMCYSRLSDKQAGGGLKQTLVNFSVVN